MFRLRLKPFLALILCCKIFALPAHATDGYASVDAIFSKYCLDCHDTKDPDGKLVLAGFDDLMKGGESGPVVVPGASEKSLLVQMVEGKAMKDGRKRIMPPKKRKKLDPGEIIAIKAWIDTGAHGPSGAHASVITELNVPKIAPKGSPRDPINTLIAIPRTNLIAVARYGAVELRSAVDGALVRTLSGHRGAVNALASTMDGKLLFSAAGEPARFGEIKEWKIADGSLVRTWTGHKDAIYALACSPDGTMLASGSYDQKIKLWNVADGKELKTLSGHNGAIFGLAFRPDGKILASASADHTVKLWDVASGERRDTLSQPLKDMFAVAFSPDGKRLAAGGADNRIRLWNISESAAETTNPLLDSKFAHDGAVLRIVFSRDGKFLLSSADDRTVRLWDASNLTEQVLLEKQPDWATGLDFILDGKKIAIGRLDGSLALYDLDGHAQPLAAAPLPPKPALARIEPHGMQRGATVRMKLTGNNLRDLTAIKFSNPKLSGKLEMSTNAGPTEVWAEVTASADLPRAAYDVSVINRGGESEKMKLYIGHLPHVYKSDTQSARPLSLPVSYWGALEPGQSDDIPFRAEAGQTVVFDLSARTVGSKANALLSLVDGNGALLASQDETADDPLLAYSFTNAGIYHLQVAEATAEGSPDYFYRVSMGPFPMVTAVFPPSLATNADADVQLIGYNLQGKDKVRIHPTKAGELEIPLDSDVYRFRRSFNVLVTDEPESVEREPNDTPAQATPISAPAIICGRLDAADVDLFRFSARAGEQWIIETDAARRGSPADTKIEVLSSNGLPVERVQLQAVRDSAVNFKPIDSAAGEVRIDNWPEMELNQFLYFQGEVCKIFRMPQGPDSGLVFYPSAGKRRNYFDTTATAHALDELCYVVEPHPPDEKLAPNGLPVFPVYFVNDDDSEREFGTDSRLHFTAPATGDYLIRVTDSRGQGGPDYCYRLIVRRPHPDFAVTLNGATLAPSAGSGRAFSLTATRADEFEGEITIDITNIPSGYRISNPIVIQAGQSEGDGTVNCDTNTAAPTTNAMAKLKVTARAVIGGQEISKPVNSFEKIAPGPPAKLWVACEPYDESATNFVLRSVNDKPLEITVAPGASVPAWIKIQRHGFDELVTFTAENLPHGVIVDNIGLNGVLIPKDESRRQIFLHAAKWVPETDRLFFIKAAQEGAATSLPVLLHLRRAGETVAAQVK